MDELMRLKAGAREQGSEYLTWNDIQACVDQVNNTVQEEHESESAPVCTLCLYPVSLPCALPCVLYPCLMTGSMDVPPPEK